MDYEDGEEELVARGASWFAIELNITHYVAGVFVNAPIRKSEPRILQREAGVAIPTIYGFRPMRRREATCIR